MTRHFLTFEQRVELLDAVKKAIVIDGKGRVHYPDNVSEQVMAERLSKELEFEVRTSNLKSIRTPLGKLFVLNPHAGKRTPEHMAKMHAARRQRAAERRNQEMSHRDPILGEISALRAEIHALTALITEAWGMKAAE